MSMKCFGSIERKSHSLDTLQKMSLSYTMARRAKPDVFLLIKISIKWLGDFGKGSYSSMLWPAFKYAFEVMDTTIEISFAVYVWNNLSNETLLAHGSILRRLVESADQYEMWAKLDNLSFEWNTSSYLSQTFNQVFVSNQSFTAICRTVFPRLVSSDLSSSTPSQQ